ncbi:TetR/AcrR family transcriptional regulator [Methylocella sp.]|uniref:TetR/AcrR family transcriptional regulator n=1 Tax=Methylocella sp. TaxID=1978226 RepID=UPI003784C41B
MARPREFDETAALDAAVACFWSQGFEATSMRDLIERTGVAGASLYNAFGDKRSIYRRALDHYVEVSVADRMRRCEVLPPRRAIAAFFEEIVRRSAGDPEQKGCMLVNAALDAAPHDAGFREAVSAVLQRLEAFFLKCVREGQKDGTISARVPAEDLSKHLLGVLLGVRVLARVRPERPLLEGVVRPALALLGDAGGDGPEWVEADDRSAAAVRKPRPEGAKPGRGRKARAASVLGAA